ncbi:MAG: hypothetical protein M1492_01365 [Gammaproteobacteria bacterium]|nr:hypothetical protein [Gammaproteobacteria bacterium]
MPQPASKSNEIVDKINGMVLRGVRSNELEIQRLRREIEKVRRIDAAEGFMLEGMLAVFLHDADAVKSAYEKSVRRSGGDPLILENYARSLFLLGDSHKSVEIVRTLPPTLLTMHLALHNGAYRTAYEKSVALDKAEQLEPHMQFLQNNKLDEDVVIDVVAYASKAVWDHGAYINGAMVSQINGSVLHSLLLSPTESIESVLGMENEIDEHFAALEDRIQRKGFAFSLEINESIAA